MFPLRLMTAACSCWLLASGASGTVPDERDEAPITLRTMGSLFFGGTVTALPDGETFHGDHGYAQFYIPQHARTYPLVLWHGIGQSGRSYETTPDGREGFMSIFPRRDWPVYIIDQPRRGRAAGPPSPDKPVRFPPLPGRVPPGTPSATDYGFLLFRRLSIREASSPKIRQP
ncbi:MAG: hypothetical protein ACLT8C_02480 [Akkermansia muciniphila]